jgi:hypothetical protein
LAEGIAGLARDPVAIRAALTTSLEHPESIPDDTLVGFFAAFTSPDKAGALQGYVAGMEPSELVALTDDLARFEAPTLIVWATDDVFFPVEWAGWLEATVPGVTRSVRVEGARLFFPLERPEVLIQELRQFWNGAVAHDLVECVIKFPPATNIGSCTVSPGGCAFPSGVSASRVGRVFGRRDPCHLRTGIGEPGPSDSVTCIRSCSHERKSSE